MKSDLIQVFSDSHVDYLHDESRLNGTADWIAFPESEADVRTALLGAVGGKITVQGARTGIAGGAA